MTKYEKVPDAIEWSKKQFDALSEERRAFDRYMWQLPLGAIAGVALFLSAGRALSGDIFRSPTLLCCILVLSSLICVYTAVSLCRFQARRTLREQRMSQIEKRVAGICPPVNDGVSSATTGEQVTETAKKSTRWEVRSFGVVPTSRLGFSILVLTALALLLCTVFAAAKEILTMILTAFY